MRDGRASVWFRTLIGIGIVVGLVLLLAGPVSLGERSVRFGPFEIRTGVAVIGAALLVMTVGLIWLFRIVRAPGEDEPPPWRYRDH
jgi:hypothetical protein